jgi:pantoate--beta-alanine ligase
MQRVTSSKELAEALEFAKRENLEVAFVPTMGALHQGHLSLVAAARRHTPFVVVSIFVNPLQFGIGEDFEEYPRTIEEDAAKLAAIGVDVLFTPTVNDLYKGNMQISSHAGAIGEVLEGSDRRGHFDGVLTVVSRLFDAVKPNYAVFGQKDAQQVYLIKQMAEVDYPQIEIVVAPTVRDQNGLALSSRNVYLSADELKAAEQISAALRDGKVASQIASMGKVGSAVRTAETALLAIPQAKLGYISLVDAKTFEPVSDDFQGPALLLAAVVVGKTRLIDNIEITF